ncbi:MAG TPA: pyridoxamine 5'-phosphate oxidase family protein [Steroidobacteraceae bacterium]|nr:pyridoxamine 5'-phosphate oxidase family protein [Steroidobacteraceae bacterium]
MDVRRQASDELNRLAALIAAVEVAMLTTVEPDRTLRSRPLRTLQMDADGALWFMTTISSPKIGEIDEHRRVSLSYSRPARETYVSVSGVTQILRDADKAHELWTPALRTWLPNGVDDPEVVLLKVTVEEAEYWDSNRNRLLPLTGAEEAPEHRTIKLATRSS